MKRVLSTSEILGTVEAPAGVLEVCASAEANYDEQQHRLLIDLDARLRTTDIRKKEQQLSATWLPKPERVIESVDYDETSALARDVFHRWVRKVRQAAPALHKPSL